LRAGRTDEAARVAGHLAVHADHDLDAARTLILLQERLGDADALRVARERAARVHARAAAASG